jgi:hypothetical protein
VHGESAARIREAIAHEEYQEALGLWKAYASRWQEAVERGEASPEQMAEGCALAEWGRTVLLCARAQLQERWHVLHAAAVYGARPAPPPRLVRISL